MIRAVVDLELARHQWTEGRRAVDRTRSDPNAHRRLVAQVEVVTAELTRRVGQVFTLDELATEYEGADRWTLEAIDDAFPDEVPAEVSTASDAAFDVYSRRASDYAP
jgi:hypothetical protein